MRKLTKHLLLWLFLSVAIPPLLYYMGVFTVKGAVFIAFIAIIASLNLRLYVFDEDDDDLTEEELDSLADYDFKRWCRKADIWGWILGGGRHISERHPQWARNNYHIETEPKMWAMSILVSEHEGKC